MSTGAALGAIAVLVLGYTLAFGWPQRALGSCAYGLALAISSALLVDGLLDLAGLTTIALGGLVGLLGLVLHRVHAEHLPCWRPEPEPYRGPWGW